jgi:hypothetical protein
MIVCGLGCASSSLDVPVSEAAIRRDALIQAASQQGAASVPILADALDDPNPVVRRTATRLLAGLGAPAGATLRGALDNEDALVRRTALRALCGMTEDPVREVEVLAKALDDPDPSVRLYAVTRLAGIRPRPDGAQAALRRAEKDADDAVRTVASTALWPFHRDVVSIRDRKDWDHEVEVVKSIQLPKADWRFKLDPKREGHRNGWYEPGFDDSGWDTIEIEQAWQKAGYEYTGVTWYRRWVDMPEKPQDFNAVEIVFAGVDESAWVWINGEYAGDHDIGPSGWNRPFYLDITDLIKWGQKNQITVRAMNTAHAGGIWRPVTVEVLK